MSEPVKSDAPAVRSGYVFGKFSPNMISYLAGNKAVALNLRVKRPQRFTEVFPSVGHLHLPVSGTGATTEGYPHPPHKRSMAYSVSYQLRQGLAL
jgi:hypothetical protein